MTLKTNQTLVLSRLQPTFLEFKMKAGGHLALLIKKETDMG